MRTATPERFVLAGYDGSASAGGALLWAADTARLRRLPLVVSHVWDACCGTGGRTSDAVAALRLRAWRVLADGLEGIRGATGTADVHAELLRGNPSTVLLHAAVAAEMVVLGAQGTSPGDGTRVGPVAMEVAAHATCPVVVARNVTRRVLRSPVVAGVDGSPGSQAALGFAVEEAALRRVPLQVVHVAGRQDAGCANATDPGGDAAELQHVVARWTGKYPDVAVTLTTIAGTPADCLARAASGAGLLVVGSHGQRPSPDSLLGTVTRGVLHRAACPVTVVHPHTTWRPE